MIMEKIDLTKCNNCRYKARLDGDDDYGRIKVDCDCVYLRSDKLDGCVAVWHTDDPIVVGLSARKVTDFEIVPRDPETYKDWQVGDKVCEDEHRNACYEVIFRSGELVFFKDWNNWASNPMTCSEAFSRFGMRLVLTDIERQIIEGKKKYEPQDGDIVAWKNKDDDRDPTVSIYKERDRGYATIYAYGGTEYSTYATFAMNIIRPATDEETRRLFDAMAKEGKRWNAEKKVVEDIPKPYEFKKGEPVLVRRDVDENWRVRVYVCANADNTYRHKVTSGNISENYQMCIPYNERTMHLLGTAEDYKEEQR